MPVRKAVDPMMVNMRSFGVTGGVHPLTSVTMAPSCGRWMFSGYALCHTSRRTCGLSSPESSLSGPKLA